jgi:hypothetical protein
MFGKLIMTEIARSHPSGEHKIIERDLPRSNDRADRVERPGGQIDMGHFRHHHGKILLLLGELPNWHGDRRWRENRRRHLIEQRLENMVISPIDQNNFGIGPSKGSRGCNPSEASTYNHNPWRLVPMHLHLGGFIVGLGHDRRNLHAPARHVREISGVMLELRLPMVQHEPAMTRRTITRPNPGATILFM